MVYEMVTTRLKMRLFLLGFLMGFAPLIVFLVYQAFHIGFFISKKSTPVAAPVATPTEATVNLAGFGPGSRAPASLGSAEIAHLERKLDNSPIGQLDLHKSVATNEDVHDSRWILVQDNYKKLVDKNEQLNALLLYHPACALGMTKPVVSGKFTTDEMIKIYTELYSSYQLRVNQLHSANNCHQAMALFDAGTRVNTKTAVAFEQVRDQDAPAQLTP